MKFLFFILSFFFLNGATKAQIKIKSLMPVPDIQLVDVTHEKKTEKALKDYKLDKGLVVIFSCNTCPFVVGTPDFPGWERQYNDLFEKAKGRNIGFVVVNSNEGKRGNEDSQEAMIRHAEEKGYKMPYLLDVNSTLANAFEAKTTPHVYLFNSDLKLVYSGSVDNIWDNKRKTEVPYLLNAMQAITEGKKIKQSTTPPKGCSIKRVVKN
jgi:hypothetical protein